jgi:hypothetical protein
MYPSYMGGAACCVIAPLLVLKAPDTTVTPTVNIQLLRSSSRWKQLSLVRHENSEGLQHNGVYLLISFIRIIAMHAQMPCVVLLAWCREFFLIPVRISPLSPLCCLCVANGSVMPTLTQAIWISARNAPHMPLYVLRQKAARVHVSAGSRREVMFSLWAVPCREQPLNSLCK